MKKLVRRNYSLNQSLKAYGCECMCPVCSCKVINFLKIGNNFSDFYANASFVD